ncbi:MAG: RluA family pseudouridine synthase, partial [Chloroflexi bacterium]
MHDDDSIVLVVDDTAIGQRLDRFVTEAVADLTRSTVQRLIEQG